MFDYADQNVIQNGLWLKKEMTVMLKQMPDVEKPIFCSVSFSLSSVVIVKKAISKIVIFRYLRTLELP